MFKENVGSGAIPLIMTELGSRQPTSRMLLF